MKNKHYNIGKNNNRYIDGRTLKQYYCKCGNKISYSNWRCGKRRCAKCAQKNKTLSKEHRKKIGISLKGKNNPMFGKVGYWKNKKRPAHSIIMKIRGKNRIHSLKTKSKMSIIRGGTGIPYENSEYGANFDSSLKEQIRARDHYTCQMCGCSQLENGKQLDVHHIDYNKKNLDWSNLITLCKSCHMKTNYNRNYWKNYFKEKTKNKVKVKCLL